MSLCKFSLLLSLPGLPAIPGTWAFATAYAVGDKVLNKGGIFSCVTAGTSAPPPGPPDGPTPGDPLSLADGTCVWAEIPFPTIPSISLPSFGIPCPLDDAFGD